MKDRDLSEEGRGRRNGEFNNLNETGSVEGANDVFHVPEWASTLRVCTLDYQNTQLANAAGVRQRTREGQASRTPSV